MTVGILESTLQTRRTKFASNLETVQESEQQRQSHSQKHSLALEADSTTHSAIFLIVFIQAGEYSTRPTTSSTNEHRCSIHCEPFYWQLIHVGDIFQARDVLSIENLMSFIQR